MGARHSVTEYVYNRHRPEESTLYKLVQQNWLTFQRQVEQDTGRPLPDFVIKEFEEYLRCGILAHGFLRLRCEGCRSESLVAFSCKRRGICPSCGARRMSESAAHLVDSVLPMTAYRQWVLSFPIPIRLCLSVRPELMALALKISNSCIARYYFKKTGLTKKTGKPGSVTLIQRFGGSLNLNLHFHTLFQDGCYELGELRRPVEFINSLPPTKAELEVVLKDIVTRLIKILVKKEIVTMDQGEIQGREGVLGDDPFMQVQASSVSYRFSFGPSRGKKAVVLKSTQKPQAGEEDPFVANNSGFSLHAGVATTTSNRDQLEKLCRYITRPAIAESRLSVNNQGRVVYRFKKPWSDGTTAVKMTPFEFIEKLIALIPRPKVHLTRFYGVLASHYKFRKDIVPKQPSTLPQALPEESAHSEVALAAAPIEEKNTRSKRYSWARLLKRVFHIDIEKCSKCGGRARIIASIEEPEVVEKILSHLRLPTSPPSLAPARDPPSVPQDVGADKEYHEAEYHEASQEFPQEFSQSLD